MVAGGDTTATTELVRELAEQNQEILDAYPDHEQSQVALADLLNDVQAKGNLSESEARLAVMYCFAGQAIGLRLATEESISLSGSDPAACQAFLQEIRATAPGTKIALFALDTLLSELRKSDVAKFQALCAEIAADSSPEAERCIAAVQLAEYKRESRDPKAAALDYLRICRDFPERFKRGGLDMAAVGCLHEAGFFLEADLIDAGNVDGELAATLCEQLELEAGAGGDGGSSPQENYYTASPNLDLLLPLLAGESPETTLQQVILYARAGRIAVERLDGKQTIELYGAFARTLEKLVLDPADDSGDRQLLQRTCGESATKLMEMFAGDWVYARAAGEGRAQRLSTGQGIDVAVSLLERGLELELSSPRSGDDETLPTAVDEVRILIAKMKELNAREAVVDAYRNVVETYRSHPIAAEMLMESGDFWRDEMKALDTASSEFQRVFDEYPDSPLAGRARVKQAMCYYEQERYEDCYLSMQVYLVDGKDTDLVPLAKFVSAMSESGMGLQDDARVHMREVVEEHPGAEVAVRALYWLGSDRLSAQEYAEALELFVELKERFPDTALAREAGKYIERLESLGKGA